MEIVPAIDIIDGKCVRLSKGDFNTSKIYGDNPLEMAKMFADAGLKRLHLVDLDGARSRHIVNTRTLESIAGNTDLIIDFGGGVKSRRDIDTAFDCGASMVIVGSTAITDRELMYEWIEEFGEDRIILGADVRNGLISVNGWKEDSDLKLDDFLKEYRAKGITRVLCTDINRDGMLQGPATELYRSILRDFPGIKLIASGGVSSIEDLIELRKEGLYEAIVGKAYYEGKITLKQLAEF
ncbi:MAG: 1-(5-phosphoribosyl)-5-[(5-phosphoribosylamino)methylideneamino]imidazole-4-carboxamide isomerase [Bacteroidaceae bacterium]|jgi:phosphoribosylformimino-5-aminoimidazole carboxamide ribotide isomerase|nr:1-(5-phosphoribosyl)-5-[(5-phosphoribosylamino)methylideneamino]imidazole-4-carboxamide isomerase [Bacteroidaceae bacterium]HBA12370.1 1-(5-phosphoribosyl)-5-[(5-phosphoribosylamino)methylideneamino]imidazole-4-carboxamide isomerase [Bacteroidales bacterium]HOD68190.1 1-(5-phosphoribosyl)-5-[(5-phosphoribosylamino)methylideneamino]imidazole-4-carboxamide isomerase [Bacteroidaceae bacterium]HQL26076.1 1-(5-phosphoribosyl)-5-[(5-phosphoribosylamino)methylideneamino]imidazole-4-carboxamide isome